ncbi:UrcA family protein [Sphingomonas sp.]|uniref:UrcA family protein n=1 Tax=Sphingomonas sp. TaxID=28214 RepID=UPI00389E552D
MKTFKITLSVFLVTAALIKGAPALAQAAPVQNFSIVRTADLDLSSGVGRAALDHRLVTAAYEVCGTPSDADLVGKNAARACRADVLATARAESAQLASRGSSILIAAAR